MEKTLLQQVTEELTKNLINGGQNFSYDQVYDWLSRLDDEALTVNSIDELALWFGY
jgi:hypothetical protein